jgi:thiol-disulfide isomerase/thioredoxin
MKVKPLSLVTLLLLPVHFALAQRGISENLFTLYGRMHGTHKDSVLLFYENNQGQPVFQSRPIYDDRFIFTDSLNRPILATIAFKDQGENLTDSAIQVHSYEMYIEPGRLYLTGDIAKMDSLKLSGSKSEDEYVELSKSIAPIKKEMQPLTERYNREKDPEHAAQIGTQFEPYDNRIKTITYQFFLKHLTSYVSLHEMVYYVTQIGLDSAKLVFAYFTPFQKQTRDGQLIAAEIQKIDNVQPGSLAPDFTAADVNGRAVALNDYKGKYVLLDFWASWCSPCREANPHLTDIYNKYNAKGLVVIGIADNNLSPDAWKKAIIKDKLDQWPNILSGTGTSDDINDRYGIHFIPTCVLIDPAGKIVGRFGDNNNAHADTQLDKTLAVIFKQ